MQHDDGKQMNGHFKTDKRLKDQNENDVIQTKLREPTFLFLFLLNKKPAP